MQVSRDELKKIALHLLLILIVVKLIFLPLNKMQKEKKELLAKKIKEYELTSLLSINAKDTSLRDGFFYKEETPNQVQITIYKYIEKYCRENGLRIINYDLPETAFTDALAEIPIILRIEGQMEQLLELLKRIKNYPKILDIQSFELTKTGNAYTCALVLVAYKLEK
ncbi:MAG: type 4a pilus biogenesis protein PilO [Candidatus Omnitrophica bacterium]|nr:type 4a pilus biogenesis protein PilO [Candidatus Omnitrophota bacterium]